MLNVEANKPPVLNVRALRASEQGREIIINEIKAGGFFIDPLPQLPESTPVLPAQK